VRKKNPPKIPVGGGGKRGEKKGLFFGGTGGGGKKKKKKKDPLFPLSLSPFIGGGGAKRPRPGERFSCRRQAIAEPGRCPLPGRRTVAAGMGSSCREDMEQVAIRRQMPSPRRGERRLGRASGPGKTAVVISASVAAGDGGGVGRGRDCRRLSPSGGFLGPIANSNRSASAPGPGASQYPPGVTNRNGHDAAPGSHKIPRGRWTGPDASCRRTIPYGTGPLPGAASESCSAAFLPPCPAPACRLAAGAVPLDAVDSGPMQKPSRPSRQRLKEKAPTGCSCTEHGRYAPWQRGPVWRSGRSGGNRQEVASPGALEPGAAAPGRLNPPAAGRRGIPLASPGVNQTPSPVGWPGLPPRGVELIAYSPWPWGCSVGARPLACRAAGFGSTCRLLPRSNRCG